MKWYSAIVTRRPVSFGSVVWNDDIVFQASDLAGAIRQIIEGYFKSGDLPSVTGIECHEVLRAHALDGDQVQPFPKIEQPK